MDLQNFKDILWELLLIDTMDGYVSSVEENEEGLEVTFYGGKRYSLSIAMR